MGLLVISRREDGRQRTTAAVSNYSELELSQRADAVKHNQLHRRDVLNLVVQARWRCFRQLRVDF